MYTTRLPSPTPLSTRTAATPAGDGMKTAVAEPRGHRMLSLHLRWVTVLVTGAALYAAVLAALLGTQDILYVPSLLLVGAAVVPVTFLTFVVGLRQRSELSFAQIVSAAALGGMIGTVVAGTLEFETIRGLGSLPTVAIGVIEESAKLAIPAIVLIWRRPRPLDGLILGVAVGSGFAALETMGYAFVELVRSGGQLGSVTQLLLLRSVTEPGGHAAWTGLACAALFSIRTSSRRWLGWLRFFAVFLGVVALHATWDSLATETGYLLVGGASFAMLMIVTWYLHRHDVARSTPPSSRPAAESRTVLSGVSSASQ
ncbi:MAG: protease PrsW [Actinomycetota bacterium]|nr:protease PrsW [Actinomycetota bacterium]